MPVIDHVVVLMLENRSFDHIFGFREGVDGLRGDESNLLNPAEPESSTNPAFKVDSNAPFAVLAGKGPGHSLNATNYQLVNDKAGPSAGHPSVNNGFVRNYRDELIHDHVPNPDAATIQVVMQSFSAANLPSINALADAFCLCDSWFSEVPGPTQPNRFYMHAATSAGYALNNWKRVMDVRTIYNSLEDAGFSWATYNFDTNEVLEFSQVNGKKQNFKLFEASFKADVTSDSLPTYSFIIPRFFNSKHKGAPTDGLANSQHAPEDARYGDNLVADVYDALRSNAAVWERSVLIVTYDEHGGFYDHVAPPPSAKLPGPVPNPDGLTSPAHDDPPYAPNFAFDRLGLRVPAVIASPLIARQVDHTLYQHTSVLATLKEIFGLTNFLTERDRSAKSFKGLFALAEARTDTPLTLPRAPLPQITVSDDDPRHPANLPLDPDQSDMLMRTYHLTQDSQPTTLTAASLPVTQGEAHDFIKAANARHFGVAT